MPAQQPTRQGGRARRAASRMSEPVPLYPVVAQKPGVAQSGVGAGRHPPAGADAAFRLAALYFLVFALSVTGVLFFVYWATADFIERQTEATLSAQVTGLAEQYAQRGLSGLVQIVAARSAGDRGDGMLYLVTNPHGRPLAGTSPAGRPAFRCGPGRCCFSSMCGRNGDLETHPARGILFTIPDGFRLLVGRDISDAEAFRARIKTTLSWSGLVALGIGVWAER